MEEQDCIIYSNTKNAWEGMFQALQGAKISIYWELYIFVDDHAGVRFFDLLEQKSRGGVCVKLIVDSFGSFWLSQKRIQSLRASGVDIRFFSPRRKIYRGIRQLFTRTHRKILVVDERIGFIGGVNIQKSMEDWDDMHIRIMGKPVRSLLRSFAKSYLLCGGKRRMVRHLLAYRFRIKQRQKREAVEFIFDVGGVPFSRAKKRYTDALLKARERVILFSPYYFPDKQFLRALWKARKRGVRVDLLIPFRTDIKIATYVAYSYFSFMKKIGVRVHLLQHMMHGKGVVVDDEWAMIGSSNLDTQSFFHNYEANIKISDKRIVRNIKMKALSWLHGSTNLDNLYWENRGIAQRTKEFIALSLYRVWFGRK
ncbi:MAG TPA: hypothetical protein DCY48_02270 [Candidatus Magasanikbacteria bacterium]|nr:MAG: hypothetical protein A3I74_01175 [Candidatus Magasanikbacteria bacterium RIFCSPLOWO2_02_FULL_47_16]OGH79945.1 MAG: hypothetical protein A3C10_02050 [Candidatus Magasanikbacteria bacterium RIFCSPHIGHO2_02_FULL_48_18]OGH82957.1 MAG: hypothetical protein A3G08_03530 [Candidatus Magasanikbacteria bacterium RIFCSPLOWO2_12_FULL_47_9b]HAZ28581.1 hypothetical protein [Candidatus Magasanikbacteria bacterium]